MAYSVNRLLIALLLFCPAALVHADDPPKPEPLAPPTPVEPEAAPLEVIDFVPALPYERIDRYAKWQYFAVDRQGFWRPRVGYTPHGAFYLYNGAPYPFTPIRSLNFMSYATD